MRPVVMLLALVVWMPKKRIEERVMTAFYDAYEIIGTAYRQADSFAAAYYGGIWQETEPGAAFME